MAECIACGDYTTNDMRWCSTACFHAEDGYPDDSYDEDDETDDEDDETED